MTREEGLFDARKEIAQGIELNMEIINFQLTHPPLKLQIDTFAVAAQMTHKEAAEGWDAYWKGYREGLREQKGLEAKRINVGLKPLTIWDRVVNFIKSRV